MQFSTCLLFLAIIVASTVYTETVFAIPSGNSGDNLTGKSSNGSTKPRLRWKKPYDIKPDRTDGIKQTRLKPPKTDPSRTGEIAPMNMADYQIYAQQLAEDLQVARLRMEKQTRIANGVITWADLENHNSHNPHFS
ncbi:hypothetical protein BC835DRAFT_560485 [Cytidiella melzeri]|nr:hypothetical protein BC835DRAFT_560485 [Cytidiella melzeri]